MKNITIIGAGNMGGSLIKAIKRNKRFMVHVYDADYKKSKSYEGENCIIWDSSYEACTNGDVILLAVKPNIVLSVLSDLSDVIKNKLVITIAAGVKINDYESKIDNLHLIRSMPNMPAKIGMGMTTLCKGKNVTDDDVSLAQEILQCAGETLIIEEKNMDGATALAGSSPAYVFMMIEAMADAGVLEGLTREQSYKLAAKSIAGSAELVLKSDKHPGELKDMICSPGGTTIEAVKVLEQEGFRNALIKAVAVCAKKSRKLSGE